MTHTGTDDLSDIIADIDLEDYLDYEGVEWRRVSGGSNLMLRECPFCGTSKWKVYFNKHKKVGLCFTGDCGARFNVFSFTRELNNLTPAATFRHIGDYARGAGVARPKVVSAPVELPSAWEMPSSIALPTPEGMTHPFLLNRGILPETQALFGLRYCDEGQWTYPDDYGRSRSMDYSKRIIIPIQDLDGTVQSFIGRDVTGEAEKRYLFPAKLPGTGRFLYGANLITDQTKLVIAEGTFDVMATYQAITGLPEFSSYAVIGSFGLSIGMNEDGDDQLHRLLELKRRNDIKEIIFLWDGEQGAFDRAVDYGLRLMSHGFSVRIGTLPPDTDPNEVSTEVVRTTIRNAETLTKSQAILWGMCPKYLRGSNAA